MKIEGCQAYFYSTLDLTYCHSLWKQQVIKLVSWSLNKSVDSINMFISV